MTLDIDEAKDKYKDMISSAHKFEDDLVKSGFTINKDDGFELGESWSLFIDTELVAKFEWNVPSFITLSINDNLVVDEDYIKDATMWNEILNNCERFLVELRGTR